MAARRILFVEGSRGGVGGSQHSLWTLVRSLDRERFEPRVVAFEPLPFWDRFRAVGISVEIWQRRATSQRAAGTRPDSPLDAMAGTVPEAADYRRQPAWRRVAASLLHLLREDLPLGLKLARHARRTGSVLLHANDRVGSNRFVLVAGLLCRRPVVVHERLVAPYRWTDALLSRAAAAIICVSRQVAEDARRLGNRSRTLLVIPNAVGWEPPVEPRPPGGGMAVGVVARLVPWKGQELFVRAMARVADEYPAMRFLIVGGSSPGQQDYVDRLRTLAATGPLAGRIEFTGHIEHVEHVIRNLRILVVSSLTPEPFGRTVIEAMLLGVPVVAPAAGGPAESIITGETGLLYPPGDADALAAAVLHLLAEPGTAARLAARALQVARQRFAPDAHARAIEAVYDDVLSGAV